MKTFLGGLLVGLIVMGVTFGMFFLGKQKSEDSSGLSVEIEQTKQGEEIKLEIVTTPVAVSGKDKIAVQASILTAVSTKTYDELSFDMAETVYVSLHGSECCGDITTEEALENLKYLDSAQTPWLFDRTEETLKSLSDNYPKTMGPDHIIGISENKMVVSFGLDDNNQINEIHIIPNADMLLI